VGKGQLAYKNGRLMCTTACMCMAVSFLSGRIGPFSQDRGRLIREIGYVMQLASSGHKGRGMISAGEAMQGIRLDRLGLRMHEFVTIYPACPGRDDEFFIPWDGVVGRIVQMTPMQSAATALFTCNSHTVCIMVHEDRQRACFFDPMQGKLVLSGISSIMEIVRESLVASMEDAGPQQFDVTLICKHL